MLNERNFWWVLLKTSWKSPASKNLTFSICWRLTSTWFFYQINNATLNIPSVHTLSTWRKQQQPEPNWFYSQMHNRRAWRTDSHIHSTAAESQTRTTKPSMPTSEFVRRACCGSLSLCNHRWSAFWNNNEVIWTKRRRKCWWR
jgi:hypothetical protein